MSLVRRRLCLVFCQAKEVLFYEPEDPNGYLSNFAALPIKVDDQVWATSEHYYQAMVPLKNCAILLQSLFAC